MAASNPQDARWWDSAVDSFVAKIAGDLKPRAAISLAMKNISSLDSATVAGIRASLEIAIRRRGFALASPDAKASTTIELTLSENLQDYIWAAVIHRGTHKDDEEQVEIVSVSRAAAVPAASSDRAMSLQRQIIWQQAGKILDFAMIAGDANGR
ncbi:MAG TPA: hypothetical protein VIH76_11970, partial [Candidatus Acidoferrales bacterium]